MSRKRAHSMSVPDERGGTYRPASDLERGMLTDGRGTSDDFPDPFGEHDIEWWVWDGERLIPASEEAMQEIEEYERAREARRRLAAMERSQRTIRYRISQRLTVFAHALHALRVWRRDTVIHHTPRQPRPASPERIGRTP